MNAVQVWTVQQYAPDVQDRLFAYESLLTDEERTRAQRFMFAADRARFIIGRALARTMLTRHTGLPPREWQIVIDEHGRPELGRHDPRLPDLRFNLSHTDGLIACALTVGREIGVDVENVHRTVTYELPERFFSAREVADLRALPRDEQDVVFFDYWTLKEAYIKARGLGLALPLGQFAFIRSSDGAPRIEFAPELHDDPAGWQFAQFWPTATHRMAVAVRRTGADIPIVVTDTIPEVAE